MNIIRQHHGTSLISYFYEKAKEQAEKKVGKTLEVDEEVFAGLLQQFGQSDTDYFVGAEVDESRAAACVSTSTD